MWDTRYRPLVFSDVLGQDGSIKVLRSRLCKGEAFNTSYVFAGGHGTGKTTLARILARAMLCERRREDGDPCNACDHCLACLKDRMVALTELDAASQGTTADMRRIVEHLGYDIPGVPKRIYVLDEAQRMSKDAQDVLLKPIEEKRVVILFCTTEYGKIRDTIKSRCETYEIRKIVREDILARVKVILEAEAVAFDDEAVLTVIDHARGHVRDVLNKLETIAQLGPITLDAVRERFDLGAVAQYYDILLAIGDAPRVVDLVEAACDRVSAPQVATGIAEAAMNAFRHAHKILTDYSQLDRARAGQVYDRFGPEVVSLARYFLSLGSHVSALDVVCAAVACGATGPVAVPSARVIVPPVVVAQPVVNEGVKQSTAPAPAAAAPATPARVADVRAPQPSVVAGRTYVEDDKVPFSPEDEAAMSGAPPRGIGSAEPVHTPSKKGQRAAPAVTAPGFGIVEFTQAFNEILKKLANGQ